MGEQHSAIRVIIADDHGLVREGLTELLGLDEGVAVVGAARDGLEAVELAEKLRPDVILLDISMPGLSGLAAMKQITKRAPQTRVLVLSASADRNDVRLALQRGASGYLLKSCRRAELSHAVRVAASGGTYLSQQLADDEAVYGFEEAASDHEAPSAEDALTDREREVLQLTAEGCTSREASERLSISPRTVENHLANVMRKLGVHTRAELAVYATRSRIIP
jgi:DNA-binding NarL/FixJ family response regulator